jgi:hypothetical protein
MCAEPHNNTGDDPRKNQNSDEGNKIANDVDGKCRKRRNTTTNARGKTQEVTPGHKGRKEDRPSSKEGETP